MIQKIIIFALFLSLFSISAQSPRLYQAMMNRAIEKKRSELNMLGESNDLIVQLIRSILAKIPEIEKDINENKTTIVDKIVDRGFTTFKEKADIEQYNGVSDVYFNPFLNNLKNELNLPEKYAKDFHEIMDVTLFSSSNEWVVFNVIFSLTEGGDCKFVCVMAIHDQEKKQTNWLVANIAATFQLAPDVFVVQTKHSTLWGAFSDSQEKIVLKPASITKKQLDVIFEFFEVIAFQRFSEILNINPGTGTLLASPEEIRIQPLGDALAALALVKSAITAVTSTWESIVSAFKTTKTSEVKQILEGKGFSYYSQSGEMQKVTGLVESYYDTFSNELIDRISVPADKKKTFLEFFQDFKYIEDDNEWKAFHTVFSVDQGESCKFVSILAHHDTKSHTVDILIADFVATFKLAPNVAIIQESASYAGGIYSDSKVVFKNIPRDVTEDDIKAIFDFFYIVTFKNFGDMVGVSANFPQL